jgi:hypothetical protein
MIAWSYGGGVQSVALAVLVREGVLPVPDLAGIADTGREVPSTWDYLRGVVQPYLAPIGLTIEVVPHSFSRVDLYATDGLTLIPAYTRNLRRFDGLFGEEAEVAEGRLPTFCSDEWKRRAMYRWYRLKGVESCDQWIGFSLDEQRRVKEAPKKWVVNRFPLIEKRLTRAMCVRLIEAAGLPVPRKSRCWMCPHQTAEEWREVKADPALFAGAVELERAINANDPQQTGQLYLYSGRVPLPLADFTADAGLAPPARPCETGHCWT